VSEASDSPDVDFNASVELLASHVPDTLVRNSLNLELCPVDATVLQSGSGEEASSHFSHYIDNFDAKLSNIGIIVESSVGNEVCNLALSIRGRSGGGFDHCRSLGVCQFFDASLTGDNVADFDRQVGVLLLLAHLKAWQEGVFKNPVVSLLEVSRHSAFNGLSRVEHKRECLMAGRSSSHVANSVLSSHLATMGDFNFESLDLLGEFDSLRIS
jgi:hypothetical protein